VSDSEAVQQNNAKNKREAQGVPHQLIFWGCKVIVTCCCTIFGGSKVVVTRCCM